MQATHVIVEGRVQGVCFRDYTCRQAQRLNLTGWVRNLPDGAVEVMLNGDPEDVSAMLQWLHKGSPRARVDTIRTREAGSGEPPATFAIRF